MTRPLTKRLAVLGGSCALLLGAGTGTASASTAALTPDARFLDVTETTPGEQNELRVMVTRESGVQVIYIVETGPAGITPGRGCARSGEVRLRCADPEQQIRVSTGGGADRVLPDDDVMEFGEGALFVDLGDGDDTYEAVDQNGLGTVAGGAGNDQLLGGNRRDVLDGGAGDDKLDGRGGPDAVAGGEGNDTVSGDSYSNSGIGTDTVDGGPGTDLLDDYRHSGEASSAPAISLSLDGQANDGRPGENDNVTTVEKVKSGSAGSFTGDDADNEFVAPQTGAPGTLLGNGGNDVLVAGDANGDVLDGGTGDDSLEGAFGDDRIIGGPGRDTIAGDRTSRCNEMSCDVLVAGNDTIEARDGEIDSISCGPGSDRVVADTADVVDATCETVERPAPGGGGGPTGGDHGQPGDRGGDKPRVGLRVKRSRLGRALRGGLRVTVTGVSGRVQLAARRGRAVVGRGTATAKGGQAVVTIRFTTKARKALRRARTARLRITGAGAERTVTLKR